MRSGSRSAGGVIGRCVLLLSVGVLCVLPYVVLVWLSCGSGWEWPRLVPLRLDGVAWQRAFSGSNGRAAWQGAGLSLAVAVCSTVWGLLISRCWSESGSGRFRGLLYLPLLTSPAIAAGCLFDLMARIQLAGSWLGVFLVQSVYGTSFAAVLFAGVREPASWRREQLVRTLGGGDVAVWRHVVLPDVRGLLPLCLFQTALLSWLDYGLTTVVGGGRLQTLTMRLFSQIREGGVSQAAASSLLLTVPALVALLLLRWRDEGAVMTTGGPGLTGGLRRELERM